MARTNTHTGQTYKDSASTPGKPDNTQPSLGYDLFSVETKNKITNTNEQEWIDVVTVKPADDTANFAALCVKYHEDYVMSDECRESGVEDDFITAETAEQQEGTESYAKEFCVNISGAQHTVDKQNNSSTDSESDAESYKMMDPDPTKPCQGCNPFAPCIRCRKRNTSESSDLSSLMDEGEVAESDMDLNLGYSGSE